MSFDELWTQVKGLPDIAMMQVPLVLTASTKKKLERKTPEEIEQIVSAAIGEINHGSITSLDELINRRL
jgi:hypothetical protein